MQLIRKLPARVDKKGNNSVSWAIFKCGIAICGKEVERPLSNGLKAKSCGCNRIESIKKHGEIKTKLYSVWKSMKQRVLNPKDKGYKNYGGRGITICPEWTNDYIVFRDWTLSNGYAEGLQINRINNDGNYEPSNCNWITNKENQRNRRDTIINLQIANEIRELEKTGKYLQKELAEKYNLSRSHISKIINNKKWIDEKKENNKLV